MGLILPTIHEYAHVNLVPSLLSHTGKSLVKHIFNFAFMWQDLAVAIQITEWCHVTGMFEKKSDSDLKEPDCLSFEEEIHLSALEALAR